MRGPVTNQHDRLRSWREVALVIAAGYEASRHSRMPLQTARANRLAVLEMRVAPVSRRPGKYLSSPTGYEMVSE